MYSLPKALSIISVSPSLRLNDFVICVSMDFSSDTIYNMYISGTPKNTIGIANPVTP